jgi:RimJ/RimL family protein N-acetyltransferase
MRVGFQELGFHKIVLRIAVGNDASEKVAKKLGFAKEGVLREELLIRGRWIDHNLYSMLEQEFEDERDPG